ncbi:hypothetical protein COY87_00410, partial [Candidatus Roizmanbacteria bacterium CG_4_10_14_0_8_um_filter_33_9]
MVGVNIVILIILILLSAFFSGAEVALLSVSQVKIKSFLKENRKGAKALQRLKANPQKMLISILIVNNIINFSAAALVAVIAENKFGSTGVSIAIGLFTLLILVFGEVTPKSIAAANAGKIALIIAKPIETLSTILSPAVILLSSFTRYILNSLHLKTHSSFTEADITSAIELGFEKRLIEPQEQAIILRALKLHDITVLEIMTPENKIYSLSSQQKIGDTIIDFVKTSFTRIPIYEESPDNITGVVNIKDILRSLDRKDIDRTLKDLSSEPMFISSHAKIDTLLRIFQHNQAHMIFVKDEKGRILGLVTLEDVLEEIVGEITDEREIVPGTIIRVDKNTIIAHGETEIKKINRFFNTEIPEKYLTLSSLIYSSLPKIHR